MAPRRFAGRGSALMQRLDQYIRAASNGQLATAPRITAADRLRALAAAHAARNQGPLPISPVPAAPSMPMPAPRPAAPRAAESMGRLQQLLSGANIPFNAGLLLLSGRGHDQPTIGEALLGAGAMARQFRQSEQDKADEQAIRDALASGPDGVKRAAELAISQGDINTAHALTGYLNATAPGEPGKNFAIVGGTALATDPATGNLVLDESGQPRVLYQQPQRAAAPLMLSPGERAVDPVTHELIAQGAPRMSSGGSGGGLTPYQTFSAENSVIDDFYRQTKDHRRALRSIETGRAAINKALAGNGPAQVAVANAFQRALVDPGVSVREGEFSVLQQAQSVYDRHKAQIDALVSGKANTVPPEVIRAMKPLLERGEQALYDDYTNRYNDAVRRGAKVGVVPSITPLDSPSGAAGTGSGSSTVIIGKDGSVRLR